MFGSFCVLTQAPEQFVLGRLHAIPQRPAAHTPPGPHEMPQPPQLFGSVLVSMHEPEQGTRGNGQAVAQRPPRQTCPVAQTFPHPPQSAGLVRMSTQVMPHRV